MHKEKNLISSTEIIMQIDQRKEFLKLTFRKSSLREREGEIPNKI